MTESNNATRWGGSDHCIGVVVLLLALGPPLFGGGHGEPDVESYRHELPPATREYVRSEQDHRFDELLAAYGANKELPQGHELQALIALSHFPELRDIRIEFVQRDYRWPIASRPRALSSFRHGRRRRYLIAIDTQWQGPRSALLLENQPFNAQIGILGHELAHTAWYIHRTTPGIVRDAVCQAFTRCRRDFETDTDTRLIYHNLGWQRYDHSAFLRAGFAADGVPDSGPGGIYMDPPELLAIIEASGLYDESER